MLITPEDLDRLARLEIEREGDHDVVWACRLARKLAWIKPTEAEFQSYIALVSHISCSAYATRHDETLFLQSIVGSESPKFAKEFSCDIKDAFLCVRPYVILETPKTQDILWILERSASWKALVDKKPLASGWLAEILVGLDGYGVRRKPYCFMPPKEPIDNVFDTCILQPSNSAEFPGHNLLPSSTLGVFLANGAKLEIELELPKVLSEDPTIKLSIGLVAARYTTKAPK